MLVNVGTMHETRVGFAMPGRLTRSSLSNLDNNRRPVQKINASTLIANLTKAALGDSEDRRKAGIAACAMYSVSAWLYTAWRRCTVMPP